MDVIILAAGRGTRFGSSHPKCLTPVHSRPLIVKTIAQVRHFLPHARIRIVLGHNPEPIMAQLTDEGDVVYVMNDRYTEDRNIWSVALGIEGLTDGALILEGDCVYDDRAFQEIAEACTEHSVAFLGGPANPERQNGIVKMEEGRCTGFTIGPRDRVQCDGYYDMTGAFWIATKDLPVYQMQVHTYAVKSLDQYYFQPLFDDAAFDLRCVRLSGKRHTFNTPEEYHALTAQLISVTYYEVEKLRHIEGFSQKRVVWLKDKILQEGMWTRPICIDPFGLVMDGQHRMEVARALGLKKVPVVQFDYGDVEIYSLRKNYEVTVGEIRARTASDNIYPYKTVKHRFPIKIEGCAIPLDDLYYE